MIIVTMTIKILITKYNNGNDDNSYDNDNSNDSN